MHPEILGLIKSYGLMLAASFGVGLWLSVRRGQLQHAPRLGGTRVRARSARTHCAILPASFSPPGALPGA